MFLLNVELVPALSCLIAIRNTRRESRCLSRIATTLRRLSIYIALSLGIETHASHFARGVVRSSIPE